MRALILTLGTITSGAVAALFLTSGTETRAAVDVNPWSLLAAVEIEEIIEGDSYQAIKTYPPGLLERQGDFEVTGYVVPVTAEAFMSTFMLVEDPANCPFCGSSGGYGPVLEVQLKRPMPELDEFTEVTVSGTIELIEDPETYQSYRLVEATATLPAR